MLRSFPPAKVLLALCLALLAAGPALAADPDKVAAAKRFLTNADRSKGILFFAHPTATYRGAEVKKVTEDGDEFSITMRYTWKSLFDETNTTELVFSFDDRGRLLETRKGRTSSFFQPFAGGDIVLGAIKDDLLKKVAEWEDATARRTAYELIENTDTRRLLNLILQMDQR